MRRTVALSAGLTCLFLASTSAHSAEFHFHIFVCPSNPKPGKPQADELFLAAAVREDGSAAGVLMLRIGDPMPQQDVAQIDFDAGMVVTRDGFDHVMLHGVARVRRFLKGRPVIFKDADVLVIIGPSLNADARIEIFSDGELGDSAHECTVIR